MFPPWDVARWRKAVPGLLSPDPLPCPWETGNRPSTLTLRSRPRTTVGTPPSPDDLTCLRDSHRLRDGVRGTTDPGPVQSPNGSTPRDPSSSIATRGTGCPGFDSRDLTELPYRRPEMSLEKWEEQRDHLSTHGPSWVPKRTKPSPPHLRKYGTTGSVSAREGRPRGTGYPILVPVVREGWSQDPSLSPDRTRPTPKDHGPRLVAPRLGPTGIGPESSGRS